MYHNRLQAAVIAGAVALAGSVFAQDKLSKGDQQWMEKEVGPLITEQEKATFQSIKKNDRKLFKELFWIRRDYNPATSENEFEKEYQERVKVADDTFKERGRKGSETDMGQLFVLIGAPDEQPKGAAGPGGDATISWVYQARPDLGLPNGLTAKFREQSGFGYRLTNAEEIAADLERVRLRLVSNPGVNYALDDEGRLRKPDNRYDPNSPAKKILAELDQTGQTSDAIAFEATPMFFRSSAGQVYIPIDLVVTGDYSGGKSTVFGAIENADGFTIYQFEEEADIQKDDEDRPAFEMPLQLQPGSYTLHLGILDDDGTTYGTKSMPMVVPDFSTGEFTLSSILLFSGSEQTGEAMGSPGKAFLLGGYHFEPKREMVYKSSQQLSGVLNAYNFGVEGDKGNLTIQLAFSKDGQKRGQTAEEPFMLQGAEMSLTIFDIPLSIKNFEEPGHYKVEITVTDKVKNQKITKEIEFEKVES